MKLRILLIYLALFAGAGLFSLPLVSTISTATKTSSEIASDPNRLVPAHPTLENFTQAWHALPFPNYIVNTLFITLVVTTASVFSASLVAYGFARFEFRGRNALFYSMLATMMLPAQVTMIPQFMIWRSLGAIDTFAPLTLPAFFGGGAFNIFLMRQFFTTIPRELDDAMLIDGCGYFNIWRRLMIPLSSPAMITIVLFSFVATWDSFDGPLIYLTSPENYTVSIGLQMFKDEFGSNIGQLMAASLVHITPTILLFLFAQRFFIRGIATSGLGGR